MLVGDPKQAIYAFWDGNVYAYLAATEGAARLGSGCQLACRPTAPASVFAWHRPRLERKFGNHVTADHGGFISKEGDHPGRIGEAHGKGQGLARRVDVEV